MTRPLKLALFGSPVAHSLSPRIHRHFAESHGYELVYDVVDCGRQGFAARLQDFHDAGGDGANVTLPLKDEAARLAAAGSDAVCRAGAANTLIRDGDGWRAENTDGAGLVADLATVMDVEGRDVLVLGAGGATAGIMAALLACSPRRVVLSNRTRARAETLADRNADLGPITVIEWSDVPAADMPDLLINATSLGHQGQAPPIPRGPAPAASLAYDLNYGEAAVAFREAVEGTGMAFRNGLGMLVEQAAVAFECWTGARPDTEGLLQELRASR